MQNGVCGVPVIKLPINIDKAQVLRYLGYKNTKDQNMSSMIEKKVDIAIREASVLAVPQINYDFFNFVLDAKNKKIIFKEELYFSGEYIFKNLEKAEEIVIAILTLGDKIEKKSAELFSQGEYLRGMIYDAVGSAALKDLNSSFFKKLCAKAGNEKRRVSRGFSPGSGDWSIEEQATIFKLLNAESIGVSLKESMMMAPVKSISVVYGLGKDLAMPDAEHDCANCNLADCQFRST